MHRLASLNRAQARPNPDGTITYVIAARDPGVHNWIDASGLTEGWMMTRWQGVPAGTDPAGLIRSVAAVAEADLAAALPAGMPQATLESRAAQIAGRIADHALRLVE